MNHLPRALLMFALFAPLEVGAQSDDLTYCDKLYTMAVRYLGKAIQGDMRPTPAQVIALEQCKAGNTATGIATLSRILVNGDITPPPR